MNTFFFLRVKKAIFFFFFSGSKIRKSFWAKTEKDERLVKTNLGREGVPGVATAAAREEEEEEEEK